MSHYRLTLLDFNEVSKSVLFGILLHNSRIPNWKEGVVCDSGFVQSHLYTIIYNERPFLGCYSFKNEIWGHFGLKKRRTGGSVQTKHSYFSMLIVPKCYNASFKSIHMIFVVYRL